MDVQQVNRALVMGIDSLRPGADIQIASVSARKTTLDKLFALMLSSALHHLHFGRRADLLIWAAVQAVIRVDLKHTLGQPHRAVVRTARLARSTLRCVNGLDKPAPSQHRVQLALGLQHDMEANEGESS